MSGQRPRADTERSLPGIAPVPPNFQKARDAFATGLLLLERRRKRLNDKSAFDVHFNIYNARSSRFFADGVLTALLKLKATAALRLLRRARLAFAGQRQGRPRRRTLSSIQCIIIAAAHDGAGISRAEILDTLGRSRIESNVPWLSRRIAYGRELTAALPGRDFVERARRNPSQIRELLRDVATL